TANPSRLANEVAEVYLGEALGPPDEPVAAARDARAAVTLPASDLRALAGTYRDAATGTVRRVRFEDGTLKIEAFGSTYALVPVGGRRFVVDDGPAGMTLEFEDGPEGRRIRESAAPRPVTLWTAFDPARPSATELAAYAGRYYSPELDTSYALEIKDGALVLDARRLGGALTPSVRDEFALGSMVLRFERDAQGRPSGFRVNAGRIRNVRF